MPAEVDITMQSFELSKAYAHYAELNGEIEKASIGYEKALSFFSSPQLSLKVAITYIKLAQLNVVRRHYYLRKALDYLAKVSPALESSKVLYYKALVYSLLGEYVEAEAALEEIKEDTELELSKIERAITSLAQSQSYIYEYLFEPELIRLYDLLKDYSLGSSRLERLKALYKESEDMVKAMELKRIYEKVFFKKFLEKYLFSDTAKLQAVALLYIEGDNKSTIEKIKRLSKKYFLDTSRLKPLTSHILERIANIYLGKTEIPYVVNETIDEIKKLSSLYKAFIEKGQKEKLVSYLLKKGFLSKKPEFAEELLYGVRKAFFALLNALYRKSDVFYDQETAKEMVKAIVNGLPLPEEEKEKLLEQLL